MFFSLIFTDHIVGKRRSLFPQKMSKSSFFYWRTFPRAWFLVVFCLKRHVQICLSMSDSLPQNLTLTEGKKGGNLMYAARQKSCTQRGLRRRFWWALWVLDYLQGGTRKLNKPTNVTGIKRGRDASASDYKQQIFRSHTQQSAAFLEGNTRIMVLGLIS